VNLKALHSGYKNVAVNGGAWQCLAKW